MRAVIGIRQAQPGRPNIDDAYSPTPTIWFASWRQLASVLSDENRALLRLMQAKQPRTVLELAELSGRAASNLSRTLRNLEGYGLVKLHRSSDTLLARITPCLENGKTAFVQRLPDDTVGWGSTEYIVMRPKPPIPAAYAYLVARDGAFREHTIRSMTGTSGRQRAQGDSVAAFKLASPPDEKVWLAFAKQVTPIFESIKSNAKASEVLAALRDTLLPKLISGELRIPDAEKFIEGAGA